MKASVESIIVWATKKATAFMYIECNANGFVIFRHFPNIMLILALDFFAECGYNSAKEYLRITKCLES